MISICLANIIERDAEELHNFVVRIRPKFVIIFEHKKWIYVERGILGDFDVKPIVVSIWRDTKFFRESHA